MCATPEISVGSGFTSMTVAPASRAIKGSCAAGCTSPDVPTTSMARHDAARSHASAVTPAASISPNHTTSGRTGDPHRSQRGGSHSVSASGSGARSAGNGWRASTQENRSSDPCSSSTRRLPTRRCSPSTFCVTMASSDTRPSRLTSA